MAGYVIENVRAGLVEQHHWDAVAELPADGSVILLDAHAGRGQKAGTARPTRFTSPLDELRGRLGELDKGKKVYVNCYSGLRSYLACRILSQHGFQCSNLSGGWRLVLQRHRPGPRCRAPPTCAASPLERIRKFRLLSLESSRFYMLGSSSRRSRGAPAGRLPDRPADPTGRTRRRAYTAGGQLQKKRPQASRYPAAAGTERMGDSCPRTRRSSTRPAAGPRPEGR